MDAAQECQTGMQRLTWRHAVRDIATGLKAMAMVPFARRACSQVPRGDARPVLLLPGFMTNDLFMRPLSHYLRSIGYQSHPWLQGMNRGYSNAFDREARLVERMREVLAQTGARQLTLLGWSLGGIYAKSLAKQHPELVREVITLGSPLAGDLTALAIYPLYERITGVRDSGEALRQHIQGLAAPVPGLPMLCIYSSNDGVVPVANAIQQAGPLVQNVDVDASHVAMPYDPFVYYLIAHRLAQSQRWQWQPLDIPDLQSRFDRRLQST